MGSVWIEHEIYNSTYKRSYKAGDIFSAMFAVIYGIVAIGMATPNLSNVFEGRVAGKSAFEIIDRKPLID